MTTPAPPRYLLGAALVFWSATTGHWFIGLVMAGVIELAHWVKLRWAFEQRAFLRAWQLCILLIAARVALTLFEDSRIQMFPELVQWGPLVLFPLQFVQSYALVTGIPAHTFSIIARRRWERSNGLGLAREPHLINFGYAYLVAVLVASILSKEDSLGPGPLLAGLLIFIAWALLPLHRARRAALVTALIAAGALSIGGMIGLKALYRMAMHGHSVGEDDDAFSQYQTAIGQLGEVKQSPKIAWRMKVPKGTRVPRLLRTTIYNHYDRGAWLFRKPGERTLGRADFSELRNIEPIPGQPYFLVDSELDETATAPSLPRISLRGEVRAKTAIPLPPEAASLTGFEVDWMERNTLGTIRIEPKEAILSGEILSKKGVNSEGVPSESGLELRVPPDELEAVRQFAAELGLHPLSTEGKLEVLRAAFHRDFRYTRYLSIPRLSPGSAKARSAISQFLTTTREGHCEFFATAATLVLREAGVPTRYAVGYSVQEYARDRNEHVMRGRHFHSWCRVWDENRNTWIDFDPTPPNWLAHERDESAWNQGMIDWLQRIREDFFLWRNEPVNSQRVALLTLILGTASAGAIGWSLWRSRHRLSEEASSTLSFEKVRTPLHGLEPFARKRLGARPTGVPYGKWLMQLNDHLDDGSTLQRAVALHQRLRFDPAAAAPDAVRDLEVLEKELRGKLRN